MKKIALVLAFLMILAMFSGCDNTVVSPPVVDPPVVEPPVTSGEPTDYTWLLDPTYSSVFIGQVITANTGMFEGKIGVYVTDDQGVSRCGYVSEDGGFALEPNFGELTRFSGGYAAAVPLQGVANYGVIDENGKFVSAQDFSTIGVFGENGFAPAMVSGTNKYGYIDHTGSFKIAPLYDMASPFSDGYALVATFDTDTMKATYGFLDSEGKVLNDATYILAQSFTEGLAPVWIGEDFASSLAGFIDTDGNMAIEAQFKTVGNFSGGLAPAVPADGELYGFINTDGEFVIEPQFVYTPGFSEGLAVVAVRNDSGDITEGYIDSTGTFVIEPKYHSCQSFRDGYASVATKAQFESGMGVKIILDKNGNVVVGEDLMLEDGVTIASVCYGNVVVCAKDGKFGLVRLADVV